MRWGVLFLLVVALWPGLAPAEPDSAAEPLLRQAVEDAERSGAPDKALVAALTRLAGFYHTHARYADALRVYERALVTAEQAEGPNSLEVAAIATELAFVYAHGVGGAGGGVPTGYGDSERLLNRALAIREATLGAAHSDVASTLTALAGLNQLLGRSDTAESLYRRLLAMQEAALGPGHPEVLATMTRLARLAEAEGRLQDAERGYEQIAARDAPGLPRATDVAMGLRRLGSAAETGKQYGEAERLYSRALAILDGGADPDPPAVAMVLTDLARVSVSQNKHEQAVTLIRRALALLDTATTPASDETTAAALDTLAGAYRGLGRPADAAAARTRAETLRKPR